REKGPLPLRTSITHFRWPILYFLPLSPVRASLHPYLLTTILDSKGDTCRMFATVEEAVEEIRQGCMVVLIDDEDRENEGDLAITILTAIDPKTKPQDLARPGHIFPLRARKGGVLVRAGQTEACVDLARIAGLTPAGVICEIMGDDGTMSRVPQLVEYCKEH